MDILQNQSICLCWIDLCELLMIGLVKLIWQSPVWALVMSANVRGDGERWFVRNFSLFLTGIPLLFYYAYFSVA